LPRECKASGAILADQIKNLDWRIRQAKRISRAPKEVVKEVLAKITTLIEDDDS
jgi:mRNA interferase MazF